MIAYTGLTIAPTAIYIGLYLYIDAMVKDLKMNARQMDAVVWPKSSKPEFVHSFKIHTIFIEVVSFHMTAIE